ncbi:MAG: chemotaxis signal relay system protein CheX [Rhodobacteraceae bacterium HLUCCA12]|nr:MAG: chemotaxis signal relay system protein CheX [Rhodobacteraceae bacterium HLUCCA12]
MLSSDHTQNEPPQPDTAQAIMFRTTRDQIMSATFTLPAQLDSLTTETLALDLVQRRGQALQIDASGVAFLGALALQLLIAVKRQWQADEKSFRLVDCSAAFLDGLSVLGATPEDLGLCRADGGQA